MCKHFFNEPNKHHLKLYTKVLAGFPMMTAMKILIDSELRQSFSYKAVEVLI